MPSNVRYDGVSPESEPLFWPRSIPFTVQACAVAHCRVIAGPACDCDPFTICWNGYVPAATETTSPGCATRYAFASVAHGFVRSPRTHVVSLPVVVTATLALPPVEQADVVTEVVLVAETLPAASTAATPSV